MLALLASILGPLAKWLLLACVEIKEKNREAIEAADDPALYRRLSRYERL